MAGRTKSEPINNTIPAVKNCYLLGGAPKMLMADLFYTHPYCYLFLYLILDAVFFGLLTTIALLAAHLTENRFLVILMPFLCYLFVFSVSQMTGAVQLTLKI